MTALSAVSEPDPWCVVWTEPGEPGEPGPAPIVVLGPWAIIRRLFVFPEPLLMAFRSWIHSDFSTPPYTTRMAFD
jgi:hypothetical protein